MRVHVYVNTFTNLGHFQFRWVKVPRTNVFMTQFHQVRVGFYGLIKSPSHTWNYTNTIKAQCCYDIQAHSPKKTNHLAIDVWIAPYISIQSAIVRFTGLFYVESSSYCNYFLFQVDPFWVLDLGLSYNITTIVMWNYFGKSEYIVHPSNQIYKHHMLGAQTLSIYVLCLGGTI